MLKIIFAVLFSAFVLQTQGFAQEYSAADLGPVYKVLDENVRYDRSAYASDEVFANFRPIATTGLKKNLVFRSSNPIDIITNSDRYNYADACAQRVGIKAEIDLADDDDDIKEYFSKKSVRHNYCYSLYSDGRLFYTHLSGEGMKTKDWPKLAAAFRFMLAKEGPFLIHCRLGRDRAGLVSMLTAALAGATLDELRRDYMTTYVNYNYLKADSYEYKMLQKYRSDRILFYIANSDYALDLKPMPSSFNVYNINPEQAAKNFFKNALGFSNEEIVALQRKLKA